MPVYTFRCKKCGSEYERYIRRMKYERQECKCDCGSQKIERVVTGGRPAAVFQDTFEHGSKKITSLKVVDPKNPENRVGSRSELRRLLQGHDRKYGTKLVFDRIVKG